MLLTFDSGPPPSRLCPAFPSGDIGGAVYTTAVFDDGTGPALDVGGDFAHVGTPAISAVRLARYQGASWYTIGTGANSTVSAPAALPREDANRLFIAGALPTLDGVPSDRFGILEACPSAATCDANCDESTALAVLKTNDFQCFLNKFAAGCP